MEREKDILKAVGRRTGMTVPDGYFEQLSSRITAQLPEREFVSATQTAAQRTLWQKIRPYAYMAASFAAIWAMMNIFDHVRPRTDLNAIENNPTLIAALSDENYITDYFDVSDSPYYEDYEDYSEPIPPADF